MTSLYHNPHITVASPFPTGDLPTLFCWRQRLRKLAGEEPEDLELFMEEHLAGESGRTFAAYRDEEIGGYFEAARGVTVFADRSELLLARVSMIFKREFFGERNTKPALNLVLHDLFEGCELVLFPLAISNRPIQSLVSNVGAVNVGVFDEERNNVWALSRGEWRKTNAEFVAELEVASPDEFEAAGVAAK